MDRTLRVWRANILPLARVMLPYAVISQVVMSLGLWGLAPELEAMQADPSDVRAAFGVLGSVGVLSTLSLWISWLGVVALSRASYPLFTGEPPPRASPLRLHLSATLAYIALLLLAPLLCAVALIPSGILLLVLAGAIKALDASTQVAGAVIAAVGLLLIMLTLATVFLWLTLRVYFAGPALASESPSSLRTLWRRCRELMSGRIGPGLLGRVPVRASILLTVISAIVFSTQIIASMPYLALQASFGSDVGALSSSVPLMLRLPAEAFIVGFSALTQPIFALLGMRFYLDQRVRREALDLELALQRRAA